METVTVKRSLLNNLIDTKLKVLTDSINHILKVWEYSSINQFLSDATNGTLEEAEMDAISLTNLRDQREKWYNQQYSFIELD